MKPGDKAKLEVEWRRWRIFAEPSRCPLHLVTVVGKVVLADISETRMKDGARWYVLRFHDHETGARVVQKDTLAELIAIVEERLGLRIRTLPEPFALDPSEAEQPTCA